MYLFLKYWVDNFPDDFKAKGVFNDLLVFVNKNLSQREVNVIKLTFVKVKSLSLSLAWLCVKEISFSHRHQTLGLNEG